MCSELSARGFDHKKALRQLRSEFADCALAQSFRPALRSPAAGLSGAYSAAGRMPLRPPCLRTGRRCITRGLSSAALGSSPTTEADDPHHSLVAVTSRRPSCAARRADRHAALLLRRQTEAHCSAGQLTRGPAHEKLDSAATAPLVTRTLVGTRCSVRSASAKRCTALLDGRS